MAFKFVIIPAFKLNKERKRLIVTHAAASGFPVPEYMMNEWLYIFDRGSMEKNVCEFLTDKKYFMAIIGEKDDDKAYRAYANLSLIFRAGSFIRTVNRWSRKDNA